MTLSQNKTSDAPPGLRPRAETAPALLSIVCPAFIEAENIIPFHKAVAKVMRHINQPYEVVFVNDGSRDDTILKMRDLREVHLNTTIIDLSRNFGKEVAVSAGLDHARGDAAPGAPGRAGRQ